MTDYRRSEEELWDEDEVADEDRRTNVLPLFPDSGASSRAGEPPEQGGAAPAEPRPNEGRSDTGDAIGSVARFIAEPGGAAPPSPVDAPKWTLSALALIANDGARAPEEAAPAAPPVVPPPHPAAAKSEPLPSMMLGPAMSTRGDATERVTTIPKTHPLANSIAPGGSRVSVPPSRPRVQRWQLALAALALLGVGAGAALFSQSRGEHHAASETRRTTEADEQLPVVLEPLEETTIVMEEPPAPTVIEPAFAAQGEAVDDDAPAQQVPPSATRERAPARAPRLATTMARSEEGAGKHALRVSVGAVQLRQPTERGATPPLDRAQIITAMNALAAELRACVGEEHGVADVTLTVRGSGQISHALVEGAFAGSERGSCIARTLRTAKLPPFRESVLHIAYPLQL